LKKILIGFVEFALENLVNTLDISRLISSLQLFVVLYCVVLCCILCEMRLFLRDKGIELGIMNIPN
jgi:hypothetical protein